MKDVVAKNLQETQAAQGTVDTRTFVDGSKRTVAVLESADVGRGVYLPGWRWSEHAGPQTGKNSEANIGYILTDQMVVRGPDAKRFWLDRETRLRHSLVVAAVIGIGLAGQGDGESGDLVLPERNGTQTAAAGLHYTIGEGSEITFTVREKLSRLPLPNDAVVRTGSLSSNLNLEGGPSEVSVDLHSLSSDQTFRDRYIRDRMFRNSPVAVFTVNGLAELPQEFFDGRTFTSQVTGFLNVNGADFPLTFDLEVRIDGDVLNVLGRTEFT